LCRYIKFDTFHPAVSKGLPVTRVISRITLQVGPIISQQLDDGHSWLPLLPCESSHVSHLQKRALMLQAAADAVAVLLQPAR
jgi:hypothetical protein